MEDSKSKLPIVDNGGMRYIHHERPPPYNPYYTAPEQNRHHDYDSGYQSHGQTRFVSDDKPIVPRRLYFGTDGGSLRQKSHGSRRSVPNLRSLVDGANNEPDVNNAQSFATYRRSSFTSSARHHRQVIASSGVIENTPPQTKTWQVYPPSTVPSAPVDRPAPNSIRLTGMRQVAQFGRFTEDTGPAGSFIHPTKISVASDGSVVVVDSQYMTIHVFNVNFEPRFMLRVIGVQGACLLPPDKLVAATHRGLQIVNWRGETVKKVDCGSVLNVMPLSLGFIACQVQAVICYNSMLVEVKRVKRVKYGKILPRHYRFRNITDVAVSKSEELLAILEAGTPAAVYVTDERFNVKFRIKLSEHIRSPASVIFNTFKRILVSDCENSRIVQFSADGRLLNYLFSDINSVFRKRYIPRGLALHGSNLLAVLTGHRSAQVNVYTML